LHIDLGETDRSNAAVPNPFHEGFSNRLDEVAVYLNDEALFEALERSSIVSV
jgi:hypothetical protein